MNQAAKIGAAALASGLIIISGANAAYFSAYFPHDEAAADSSLITSHLPAQKDIYRPPALPDFFDSITAKSAMINVVADPPKPLLRYRGDETVALASLTKLMTALVVLDNNPDWAKEVTIESSDIRGGARQRIWPGQKINVSDLWKLMLVGSDNDATAALVRFFDKSESEFVEIMNKKASALGLMQTKFFEPTGLSANNVSTAREFAIIAREAFSEPEIADTLALADTSIRVSGANSHIYNTDQELKKDYIDQAWSFLAGKTGYIEESGYNVALLAKTKTEEKILIVAFGFPSLNNRTEETRHLIDWAIEADGIHNDL